MSVRYKISTWNSSTATEAREYREVKRLDAALTELWKQIYDMIKADAGLDTERGKRLSDEFDAFCKRAGEFKTARYLSEEFLLRSDRHGKLDHVLFTLVRN